jgi:hypothetical protein
MAHEYKVAGKIPWGVLSEPLKIQFLTAKKHERTRNIKPEEDG